MRRSIFGVFQFQEIVGAVVLACIGVFIVVLINAGLLKDWFQPSFTLRILLPDEGVSGLAPGAEVQVLGTRAGEVRRIVIDPNQRMHAVARVEDQMRPFIRRDSVVSIRRQFGVAGAAFIDISRGTGPELDWSYAVIAATSERAPTDTLGQMIDELRAKVIPILDDVHKAVEAFTAVAHRAVDPAGPLEQTLSSAAAVVRKIESGDGVAGRLIANEMAPRVHNSGHWTIEGAITSQFENHLRAILGLPLGAISPRGFSAMVNLIGEMPQRERLLAMAGVHLHDYGKTARPGRKMGHCTLVELTAARRDARARALLKDLRVGVRIP